MRHRPDLAAVAVALTTACRTPVAGRGHPPDRLPGADTIVRVPAVPGTVGYLAYLPEGYFGGADAYPVIVFLHGSGEQGNGRSDLDIVSSAALPGLAATDTLPVGARRFTILAPQIDADRCEPHQIHSWLAGEP